MITDAEEEEWFSFGGGIGSLIGTVESFKDDKVIEDLFTDLAKAWQYDIAAGIA